MSRRFLEYGVPLRGALIGCGNVALAAHVPSWRESSDFVIGGIFEPVPERARIAAEAFPEAHVFADLESLLSRDDFDFVDICTPPCFHADIMLAACRAGLHVLCEKPLVTTAESLTELRKAARKFDRVIFSVNNWKHAPLWKKVRGLVCENRIGALRKVELSVLRTSASGGGASDWRRCAAVAGGGILLDHGWHHLYLILSLFNEPPLGISARMESIERDSRVEETVDLNMRFPLAEATLHMSWRALARRNCGIITGESGTIFINDDHVVASGGGLASVRYDFPEALSRGSHHPEWMKPVFAEFRQEIFDKKVRGTNFREAGWCLRLAQLAYRSHREGACSVAVEGQAAYAQDYANRRST